MRRTALSLIPTATAIIKAVQWVASTGGSVNVNAATRSTTSGLKQRDARRPRFVTQKAIDAFLHEPLLPAPDAGLRFARPAHDLVRSDAVRAQEDDRRPPHMFLGGVAVPDRAFKATAVGRKLTVKDIPVRMRQTRKSARGWESLIGLFR